MPDITIRGLPHGHNRSKLVSRLSEAVLDLKTLEAREKGLLITCPGDGIERSPCVISVDTKMVQKTNRDAACLKAYAATVEKILREECPSATILVWPPELHEVTEAGFLLTMAASA